MFVEAEIRDVIGITRRVEAENMGRLQSKIQKYLKDEKVFRIDIFEKKIVRSLDGLAIKNKR